MFPLPSRGEDSAFALRFHCLLARLRHCLSLRLLVRYDEISEDDEDDSDGGEDSDEDSGWTAPRASPSSRPGRCVLESHPRSANQHQPTPTNANQRQQPTPPGLCDDRSAQSRPGSSRPDSGRFRPPAGERAAAEDEDAPEVFTTAEAAKLAGAWCNQRDDVGRSDRVDHLFGLPRSHRVPRMRSSPFQSQLLVSAQAQVLAEVEPTEAAAVTMAARARRQQAHWERELQGGPHVLHPCDRAGRDCPCLLRQPGAVVRTAAALPVFFVVSLPSPWSYAAMRASSLTPRAALRCPCLRG